MANYSKNDCYAFFLGGGGGGGGGGRVKQGRIMQGQCESDE